MPRFGTPLKNWNALLVRVEHHLLGFAHVGPHERHPAVAEADLRHLHGDRRAVEQDVLVAPVELVGFARREAQRHISRRRPLALPQGPRLRVTPNIVVAALIAGQPQLLEHALERQPLALGLVDVRRKHRLQRRDERAKLRQRLLFANVLARRRLAARHRPHDVANRIPGELQLPRDRLDLPALHKIRPPNPADRVHRDHPPLDPLRDARTRAIFNQGVGSKLRADHPQAGVKIARRCTACRTRSALQCWR